MENTNELATKNTDLVEAKPVDIHSSIAAYNRESDSIVVDNAKELEKKIANFEKGDEVLSPEYWSPESVGDSITAQILGIHTEAQQLRYTDDSADGKHLKGDVVRDANNREVFQNVESAYFRTVKNGRFLILKNRAVKILDGVRRLITPDSNGELRITPTTLVKIIYEGDSRTRTGNKMANFSFWISKD